MFYYRFQIIVMHLHDFIDYRNETKKLVDRRKNIFCTFVFRHMKHVANLKSLIEKIVPFQFLELASLAARVRNIGKASRPPQLWMFRVHVRRQLTFPVG